MTTLLLNGTPTVLSTVGVAQTVTVEPASEPTNVINATYRVKGGCDDLQAADVISIESDLDFNLNRTTWSSSFVTTGRALPLGGRGVLIELTLYLSDGTTDVCTGIVYSIVDALSEARPLVAGQTSETSALSGWVGQANAALRGGTDGGLGTPIASIPTASDPNTIQIGEPVGTSRIWFDPTALVLYVTRNGTATRMRFEGTPEVVF